MSAAASLRAQLTGGFVVAPVVYDGLTALLAQREGFGACAVTLAGTATQLGLEDPGVVGVSELVDHVGYLAEAVEIPVIAEAVRAGTPRDVARLVREGEAAGVAGFVLGDEAADGETVVPLDDVLARVRAARDSREDADTVVVVRTAALASAGWQEALRRVAAFREAGADLVGVAGVETDADLERLARDVAAHGPTMHQGAAAPVPHVRELGLTLHVAGSGHVLSALALRDALQQVRTGESAAPKGARLRFDELTSLLGLDEVYEIEARYAVNAEEQ